MYGAMTCPLCKREIVGHDTIFLPSDVQCVVCMHHNVNVLMTPCKHACMCDTCFKRMRSRVIAA